MFRLVFQIFPSAFVLWRKRVNYPLATRHLPLVTVLIAALATCHSTLATAQTGLATLSGTVTDPSGAVIPKASVSVTNEATKVISKTQTNSAGVYVVPGLIPGPYRLRVEHAGFKQIEVEDIELHTQDILSRNFVLPVGATSETIQVSGNGVNINTTDASVSTVIDRDFVENMPLNGRSLQDLWALVPGVASVGGANGSNNAVGANGFFTVNGQRTEANSFSVDGVSANVGTQPGNFGSAGFGGGAPAQTALGTTQSLVSVDALQEFRATTSTYSAELGRTPGGQFSFTTRSGTNDWRGSGFDYFRNEALDANNWFNTAVTPIVPREKERQNDFGGTLGGPIRIPHLYNGKNRTFFFFSYEGLRLLVPQGLNTETVPDQTLRQSAPAGLESALSAFPLPNGGEDGLDDGLGIYESGLSYPSSVDSLSVRVDHNFTDKFKVFGRYASTPSVTSYVYPPNSTNTTVNNRLVTLGVTNLVAPSQSNELRLNITQADSIEDNVLTNTGGGIPFSVTTLPGPNKEAFPIVGSYLYFSLNFSGYPEFQLGQTKNAQRQYNVTDAYNWTIGSHSLKFGIDWRRLATYTTPYLIQEYAQFASEAEILNNDAGPDGGSLQAFSESPSPVEPLYKNFSAFVQDEWKITPRLSLSAGIRWDINPAPSNLTGPSPYTLNQITHLDTAQLAPANTPLWKTDWLGFAPRIGAAFQLHQAPGRESVFRGGFGLFYDMGNTTGSSGFGGLGFQSFANFTNVSFPLSTAQVTLPPPSTTPPYSSVVYAFDPNLKLPYTLQWNLALEQEFGSKQALTVNYLGSGGRRLLETFFVNPDGNPYLGFGAGGSGAEITRNGQTSAYNALQISFQRTLSHGLQTLASYTWSHSIDEASSNFNLSDLLERASADFDIRQNFQTALTYDMPGQYSNAFLSGLLAHWSTDARVSAQSALPVDVLGRSVIDAETGQGVYYHPNLVAGEPLYLKGSQYPGGRIINYYAFNIPASGPGFDSEGDTPRNFARGFGAWQINCAVRREFPVYERLHLQFRAEAFNVLNHPAFSGVGNRLSEGPYVPNPQFIYGFGVAQGSLNSRLGGLDSLYQTGGPRSLQLALKVLF